MKLGNNILKLRKKKGISQEQLGEKINVTRQTISNWELGETSPNPEQLKLLSKELNVSIDELLDNDIKTVIEEKVTNTEKKTNTIVILLKFILLIIIIGFAITALYFVTYIIAKNSRAKGAEIEEAIYCKIYGEEHSFNIVYEELTGEPIELGGDPYFSDILDLGKYNDAHQIFNVINDYVKKNGGTCSMSRERELNNLVEISVKEISNKGVTINIKELDDYDIVYGTSYYLETYNSDTEEYEKVKPAHECIFNEIAFTIIKGESRDLSYDFSCYGNLPKGEYRLVIPVDFESDTIPVSEYDFFYIWVDINIE